jgi:hypothetical protein
VWPLATPQQQQLLFLFICSCLSTSGCGQSPQTTFAVGKNKTKNRRC